MARVVFSSNSEYITGKLAGSVFQDSYFGIQIRSRVTPRNPQTFLQQLRRGEFAYLRTGFRDLSAIERSTWGKPGPVAITPIDHYTANSINLSLINLPPVKTYVDASFPALITVEWLVFTTGQKVVKLNGAGSHIPNGVAVVLFSTDQKEQQKLFNNPSDFSPIKTFDPLTPLSSALDITAAWTNRYGATKTAQRVCLFVAAIDQTNGNRTNSHAVCAIEGPVETSRLIAPPAIYLVDPAGNYLTY